MATVLHVLERYLPLSAGFVHGQLHRSRHRGVVVSRLATDNREAFPHEPVRQLPGLLEALPEAHRQRARNVLMVGHALWARADIAHAHFGYALPDVAVLARRLGLPVVASLHGHDVTALPAEQPWVFEQTSQLVSAAVVPSEFLVDVVTELGIARERIHVIPAGIDTSLFTPTPLPDVGAAPVVAFVGRFVEKKGLAVLLEAWPSVRAAQPDARLRILGSGPLEGIVDAAASDPASGVERVVPDPARRSAQVLDLIRSATVVATPSLTAPSGDSESLLLVNLEAQASGRPVVTTRHGGIPEFVVDGGSALLVPEGDARALAGALTEVVSERALAERLARAGPAVAARFDAAAMAARVDALYESLLVDGGAARGRRWRSAGA